MSLLCASPEIESPEAVVCGQPLAGMYHYIQPGLVCFIDRELVQLAASDT